MAVDENGNEINNELSSSEKRIVALNAQANERAAERDSERAAKEKVEAEKIEIARERDFYQGFSDVVSTNPSAKDHKDDILAKVKSGYTVEDATYAVLGKLGKLAQPKVEHQAIAGGSAVITPPQGGANKQVSEMSRDEKRAALMELERSGDISLT